MRLAPSFVALFIWTFLGATAVALSSHSLALDLGEVTIKSFYNEPLNAEIRLLQVQDVNKEEIMVSLASKKDFERMGLERSLSLTSLSFEVVIDSHRSFVRVTSPKPIEAPYLSFLMDTQWPGGRLWSEYTLLPVLPVFTADRPSAPMAPPEVKVAQQQGLPIVSSQSVISENVMPVSADGSYRVRSGDTLSEIASEFRPNSSVSIQQMMLAIQAANPDAFISGNIHLLRKGKVLRVPVLDEIENITRYQMPISTQQQNLSQSKQSQNPMLSAAPELPAPTKPSTLQGRLTLGIVNKFDKGEGVVGSSSSNASESLQNELMVAQEELDKATRESRQIKSQVAELGAQIETIESLLQLTNDQLRAVELAKAQEDASLPVTEKIDLAQVNTIDAKGSGLAVSSTVDAAVASFDQATIAGVDISGNVEVELTGYNSDGQFSQQDYRHNLSVAFEPEFYWEWNAGSDSLAFRPFLRIDEHDDRRSHGDIRELAWVRVAGQWELRAGIQKVFWGVTEFNHLVDIINQTDGVDSFGGEEKLGQPMLNLSYAADWGVLDAFILPGFRERTFAGESGRLRSRLVVDTENASYESGREEKHIDYALRWSHSIDVFDLGVYWFDGTRRQPILQAQTSNGTTVLRPFYPQIRQLGVDFQATIGNWLWKLETIQQRSRADDFSALQAGFEYTFYGVNNSSADVGWLLEYGWDERDTQATQGAQNDIYIGTRVTMNDADDNKLLLGLRYDADFHTKSLVVEASRRLSDYWTIALDGQIFQAGNTADRASAFNRDDNVQLTVKRFF